MVTATAVLNHPLTLLVVGAVLSGLLLPYITGKWQDRRKELEIKTEMVAEIWEAVTSIMIATQIVYAGGVDRGMSQQQFNEAYATWMVERAVIRARLHAYFPPPSQAPDTLSISDEWEVLSRVVESFYALAGVRDEQTRRDVREQIRTSLESLSDHEEGDERREEPPGEDWFTPNEEQREWVETRNAIDLAMDDLTRRILRSTVELG